MRSLELKTEFWPAMCERVFEGVNMTSMKLPAIENTVIDQGGFNIQASNIFFANGNEDPWKWAAIQTSRPELN